jgi:hypothetical protein
MLLPYRAKFVNGVHRHFLWFPEFAAQQNISLPISRRAFGEERANFLQRIFHPQQRSMRLVADPLQNRFCGTPKADGERVFL